MQYGNPCEVGTCGDQQESNSFDQGRTLRGVSCRRAGMTSCRPFGPDLDSSHPSSKMPILR
jgi:hypothetical protein